MGRNQDIDSHPQPSTRTPRASLAPHIPDAARAIPCPTLLTPPLQRIALPDVCPAVAAVMQRRWSKDHLLTPREGAPGAHGSIWRPPLPSDGTGAAAAPESVTSPSTPPASTIVPSIPPFPARRASSSLSSILHLLPHGDHLRRSRGEPYAQTRAATTMPEPPRRTRERGQSPCARSLVSNPREGCTHKASQRPGADPPSRVHPIGSASGRMGGISCFLSFVRHAHHMPIDRQPSAHTATQAGARAGWPVLRLSHGEA